MSQQQTILVTGATGTVGGEVARQLISTDVHVRALVRKPEAAQLDDRIEVIQGDLSDPAGLDRALQGVDAVFLVWPFMTSDGATDVLEMIKKSASRVVYLSTSGAGAVGKGESNPIMRFHGELEDVVQSSGVDWVMLHPSSFASNTLSWAPQFRDGVVRAPFGSQGRALIHEEDIAAVAVRALVTDELLGTRPDLTGPDTLTTAEQVQAIGAALDVPVQYEEISTADAAAQALAAGWPADLVAALFDESRTFEPQQPTSKVEEILGRPARSLQDWARDHADAFTGEQLLEG